MELRCNLYNYTTFHFNKQNEQIRLLFISPMSHAQAANHIKTDWASGWHHAAFPTRTPTKCFSCPFALLRNKTVLRSVSDSSRMLAWMLFSKIFDVLNSVRKIESAEKIDRFVCFSDAILSTHVQNSTTCLPPACYLSHSDRAWGENWHRLHKQNGTY